MTQEAILTYDTPNDIPLTPLSTSPYQEFGFEVAGEIPDDLIATLQRAHPGLQLVEKAQSTQAYWSVLPEDYDRSLAAVNAALVAWQEANQ